MLSHVFAASTPWTAEWDKAILDAALKRLEPGYDPRESMLSTKMGSEYRYHTMLRNQVAHPTRDSLDYALLLLEAGGVSNEERAKSIIGRVIALQVTDPDDTWYGIWGWYMEEPPAKMQPADRNWADFLGSLLLLIENRHGGRLGALRPRVLTAIHHAARSVIRRNVAMSYTNIAVKGTFVTKAAGELLGDREIEAYADDRLKRLAAEIDQSGSFAEYNSPTYALVSIVNFTRFAMVVRDEQARAGMRRIEERMWLHFARHWHATTRQFAGPMSRCYETLLRTPVWLQKSLDGQLVFATRDEIASSKVPVAGEIAYLKLECPKEPAALFLRQTDTHEHRELFIAPGPKRIAIHGVTYLTPSYTLGSVNRSEFWVQRRPLLAYWMDQSSQPAYLQLRFVKDDYDFSSAMLYSVQTRSAVLGAVNFISPGGDKHLSLDPVRNGAFLAREFYLEWLFAGGSFRVAPVDGVKPLMVETARRRWRITIARARFGQWTPRWRVVQSKDALSLRLDLIPAGASRTIEWRDIEEGSIIFSLEAEPKGPAPSCELLEEDQAITSRWNSPEGLLELRAGRRVASMAVQDELFRQRINGQPAPLLRLREEPLLARGLSIACETPVACEIPCVAAMVDHSRQGLA
jgi:hypothetical protein